MLNVLKINFTTAIYNGKVSFTSLPNLNSITEIVASYLGTLVFEHLFVDGYC